MKYFLKRCGFQELGSIGDSGKAKRGRYLMISGNQESSDFFPKLRDDILNDSTLLEFITLYSKKRTLCNYVWHNSGKLKQDKKKHRNERRIYLNSELDESSLFFSAEDILIVRKNDHDIDGQNSYLIDLLKDHSSSSYVSLSYAIENYPIPGGYGFYEGYIPSFEEKVSDLNSSRIHIPLTIDQILIKKYLNSDKLKPYFTKDNFQGLVLSAYKNKCAVTNEQSANLDVVYIIPPSLGGSFEPQNGLPLSRNLSLQFILGLFTISDKYEIIVHKESNDKTLQKLNSKKIHLPSSALFAPNPNNLHYHQTQVFGSFKKYLEQ